MSEYRLISIVVRGKVQGVSFRAATKAVADQLGIKGTIRNKEDGTLQIKVSGQPFEIDQFLEWCREGPDYAEVESVHIEEHPKVTSHAFLNFEILK